MQHLISMTLALAALTATVSTAQNERPLAIKNARILTLAGDPIDNGVVLVQNGRIKSVGAKVKIPAGAKVIDAEGGTVMPGLVSAWSATGRASANRGSPVVTRFNGRFRTRSSRQSNPVNKAATKIAETLYARQQVFRDLLEAGVTTLAVAPDGVGFPGMAARVALDRETEEGFILDDDAYLVIECEPKTKAKKTIKAALDAGKKALEERKKPKEEPKKPDPKKPAEPKKPAADSKPTDKPGEPKPGDTPKPDQPKPDPKPKDEPKPKPGEKPKTDDKAAAKTDKSKAPAKKREKKKDPNAEAIADLLDGKRRAFVVANSSNQLVHYADAIEDHEFEAVLVADRDKPFEGSLYLQPDAIKKHANSVLIAPDLTTPQYTRVLHDPGAELRAAGLEVGYVIGDSRFEVRALFFKLIELVRYGASRDDVLRGVTAIPAKMLGVDHEVGTIEKGKRANLLLFSGDPLDPSSMLETVFYEGAPIEKEATR